MQRVLLASAAVTLAFGLALLLAPAHLLAIYGVTLVGSGDLVARVLGGQLLGFAAVDLLGARADRATQRVVLHGGLMAEVASFAGAMWVIPSLGGNPLIWTIPLTFAGFAMWRGTVIWEARRSLA